MREVSADTALRMIIGTNDFNQPYLFVVLSERPRPPQLSSAIAVEVGQRTNDQRWTLTIRLIDDSLSDTFITLMSDIAERSALEESESASWALFVGLLTDLQHLLVPKRTRLSLEALRGLFAELWFGFDAAPHGRPLDEAVTGWNGPFKGDQDFNFPAPTPQFEVKSRRPGRSIVDISSLRQLDREDIHLAVVTIEDLPARSPGASLPDLVATIRGRFDAVTRVEFNRRLAELVVDLDDPWYREQKFRVTELALFVVGPAFPRLRRSHVSQAIVDAVYQVDLRQVADHLVTATTIQDWT
jgi:hypothetical protein